MSYARALAIVGVVALAGWLAVIVGSGRSVPAALQAGPRRAPAPLDPLVTDIQSQAGRLHAYLNQVPAFRPPARNPFQFAARPEPLGSGARRPAVSAAAPSPTPLTPARPPLRLSGIAEDATPDGTTRTAIISGLQQLFLVKEGEEFARRFKVVKIGSDGVELVDLLDGATLTLYLR
jgi:hypothetical protein